MTPPTLLTHEEFGTLRLHQVLPPGQAVPLANWEYLEHDWVGEGYGFTSVLQLKSDPERTRAVDIQLRGPPAGEDGSEEVGRRLLRATRLPLERGIGLPEIIARLGGEMPIRELTFVPDRRTYEFTLARGGPDRRYEVSCTVLHEGGLTFVTIHTPLPDRSDEPGRSPDSAPLWESPQS